MTLYKSFFNILTFIGSEDYAVPIMLCRDPVEKRLLRVPIFWQNPARRGAKISRDFVQNVYSQDVLAVQLLANIFRSCHQAFGIQGDSRISGIHAVYGSCLAVSESHTSDGDPPSTVRPRDHFLRPVSDGRGSYERGWRSTLVYRLGPLPGTCWDTFSSSGIRVLWVPGHSNPGNDIYLFCHL